MTRKTIAVMGDSQTDVISSVADAWNVHGPVLSRILRHEGYKDYRTRVFGTAGDTTTQMLARAGRMFYFDTAEVGGIVTNFVDIAYIYGGVNDPGASITSATTTLNLRAMILMLKHGAKGDERSPIISVATQASLPYSGAIGRRYVVLSDTSTTGGVAASHTYEAATITGTVASSGPSVWEYRNPLAGELGWGRIAVSSTAPTVVKKIIVVSTNYLNWTTGGDTPAGGTPSGAPYSSYPAVRIAQQAAVTAEAVTIGGVPTVVYADLFNFQKSRILAGTDPNFSADTTIVPMVAYDQTKSWHVFQNNQHHEAYGHSLVAQCVRNAIPSAWLS